MFKELRLEKQIEGAWAKENIDNGAFIYLEDREGFEVEMREITKQLLRVRKIIKKNGVISKEELDDLPEFVQDFLPKQLLIR